jgi:uncharacterized protein (TIRG00374 family)
VVTAPPSTGGNGLRPPAPDKRSLRPRFNVRTAIKILVSVGLFAFIFTKAGVRSIGHELAGSQPAWLAIAFLLAIAAVLASVVQWQVLLAASGMHRTCRRCAHLDMAGRAFDAAMPSSIGGDVMRTFLVANGPNERVPAARTIVLRRVTGIPGMVFLLGLGIVFAWHHGYSRRVLPYAAICIGLGAIAMVVCASPLLGWMGRRRALQRSKASRVLAEILEALHQFRSERMALLIAALLELGFWLLVVANAWAFMRAVGTHPPIAYAAVVILTVNALSMLPISIGGYGLREGTFSLFLAVGAIATSAQGAAVGLCITLQAMLIGAIGIPFYLSLGRSRVAIKEEIRANPSGELT